jgi:hypothetical protein
MMRKHFLFMGALCAALWVVTLLAPAGAQVGAEVDATPVMGTDGTTHTLRDNIGKSWTVVAWYPKAATGG